jgi:hypothetical protein
MAVKAEDLGYPSPAILRERIDAYKRRKAVEIREAAERHARGEGRPRRQFTAEHRERLRRSKLDRYFEVVLAEPSAPPLRKLRALERLTAAALSERARVGERTVFRAENAPDTVSHRTWARLADALGVAVSEIKP